MNMIDVIFALFAKKGRGMYFGEAVTETEHALQTAHLAERNGADRALVTAALLHDVGHLLHGLPEDIAQHGVDGRHEAEGAAWLERYFGPNVVLPVRMHVDAKRYLCAVEPAYLAELSSSSRLSLQLQGGPLPPEEARRFEGQPGFASAVAVRRWDDAAKVPGLRVPDLEHYRPVLEAALQDKERG